VAILSLKRRTKLRSALVGNTSWNIVNPGTGRAVFMGGNVGNNTIDYITIATTGNAINFGDLNTNTESNGGNIASTTRGITFAGELSGRINDIQYITIASTGNATDFGDALNAAYWMAGISSDTRGLLGTGTTTGGSSDYRTVGYITIASTGNATNFGEVIAGSNRGKGTCGSTTRGVFAGGFGNDSSVNISNAIDYFTIASTGNGTDFGDLTLARGFMTGGGSSGTRGLIAGGSATGNVANNTIDYITIASTGNATDFGDLSSSGQWSSTSNKNRMVSGTNAQGNANIVYVQMSTTGNSTTFGSLTVTRTNGFGSVCDAHGGL